MKQFPAFYGTLSLIIVFKRLHHWTVSWARWIQPTPGFVRSDLNINLARGAVPPLPPYIFMTWSFQINSPRPRVTFSNTLISVCDAGESCWRTTPSRLSETAHSMSSYLRSCFCHCFWCQISYHCAHHAWRCMREWRWSSTHP